MPLLQQLNLHKQALGSGGYKSPNVMISAKTELQIIQLENLNLGIQQEAIGTSVALRVSSWSFQPTNLAAKSWSNLCVLPFYLRRKLRRSKD